MSLAKCGYANKILRINLTDNSVQTETLDPEIMRLLLGGKGLGAWLLYNEISPKIDPLSPENIIIIVVGPLTGTSAPTSGRFGIITKSPATGTILDAYCGGFFGQTMKYAGYDAIVIRGAAKTPISVIIDNDEIRFEDASGLWGKNNKETNAVLHNQLGDEFKSIIIGTAGERCSPISGVFAEERTAGRGGVGAVVGSKKLKSLSIRGSGKINVADPNGFREAVHISYRMLRMNTSIRRLLEDGTANILELVNAAGALPTKNFQFGQFAESDQIEGRNWKTQYWKRNIACFGCPITCSKVARSQNKEIIVDGPDFETIFALGSNCGISDKEAILYANYICDLYGIDTISTGNIVGFVMELYEKGFIISDDLDGIKAEWGDGEAMVQLVEKIATGEGAGALLQQGVKKISEKFPGSEKFAMHVKGLEMPGYLPRAAKGIALSYAISERGACHLKGSPLVEILGGADPLAYQGKAELFKTNQSDVSVINALVLCYFVKFGITLKEIFQMINPCTGFDYKNPKELELVGERITTLARMFNVREGFSVTDDTLPERELKEALANGPARGETVNLELLRSEYYQLMGWDEKGVPTEKTLKRLGLTDILN